MKKLSSTHRARTSLATLAIAALASVASSDEEKERVHDVFGLDDCHTISMPALVAGGGRAYVDHDPCREDDTGAAVPWPTGTTKNAFALFEPAWFITWGFEPGTDGERLWIEAAASAPAMNTLKLDYDYDNPDHGVYRKRGVIETSVTLPADRHTLALSVDGSGSVVSTPAVLDCSIRDGAVCRASFATGEEVALLATPASGFELASWGTCSSTNDAAIDLRIDADVSCAVVFVPVSEKKHRATITVIDSEGLGAHVRTLAPDASIDCYLGNGSTCEASFAEVAFLELEATIESDASFAAAWAGDCLPYPNEPRRASMAVDGEASCRVTFERGNACVGGAPAPTFVIEDNAGAELEVYDGRVQVPLRAPVVFDASETVPGPSPYVHYHWTVRPLWDAMRPDDAPLIDVAWWQWTFLDHGREVGPATVDLRILEYCGGEEREATFSRDVCIINDTGIGDRPACQKP